MTPKPRPAVVGREMGQQGESTSRGHAHSVANCGEDTRSRPRPGFAPARRAVLPPVARHWLPFYKKVQAWMPPARVFVALVPVPNHHLVVSTRQWNADDVFAVHHLTSLELLRGASPYPLSAQVLQSRQTPPRKSHLADHTHTSCILSGFMYIHLLLPTPLLAPSAQGRMAHVG